MKLTVLGKYGAFPAPGGACSGYLVEQGSTRLLIDCGSGVLSRVQQHVKLQDITAILLSHLHSDHIGDLWVLRYAHQILSMNKPIPLYLPATPQKDANELMALSCFETHMIRNHQTIRFDHLSVDFFKMMHPIESYAMRFIADKTLVYSGDTTKNDELISAAKNADMLLCDSAMLEPQKGPHMSARQAGDTAKEANVKRLLLTHMVPFQDEQVILAQAKESYKDAEISAENVSYEI